MLAAAFRCCFFLTTLAFGRVGAALNSSACGLLITKLCAQKLHSLLAALELLQTPLHVVCLSQSCVHKSCTRFWPRWSCFKLLCVWFAYRKVVCTKVALAFGRVGAASNSSACGLLIAKLCAQKLHSLLAALELLQTP